ncbi:MAG: hypothetical protein QXQ46_11065 [Thermoplasmatales archaeon]
MITIRNGTIQDATFITSDPRHKRKGKTEMMNPELHPVNIESNDPAENGLKEKRKLSAQLKTEERMNAKTRTSGDGTWTKKNSKSYFGFKLHTIQGA